MAHLHIDKGLAMLDSMMAAKCAKTSGKAALAELCLAFLQAVRFGAVLCVCISELGIQRLLSSPPPPMINNAGHALLACCSLIIAHYRHTLVLCLFI